MNSFKKEVKNRDKSVDIVYAKSDDKYNVMIGDNYKLIKVGNNNGFKDTLFGSDIGIANSGFVSMITIAMIVAVSIGLIMLVNFRI